MRLAFAKGPFGPYAEEFNDVLQKLDGHFVHGCGDRTTVASIQVDRDALDQAASLLEHEQETRERVHDVRALIAGFESPFGLELLTTVHWAAHNGRARDAGEAAAYVASWNDRKRRVFASHHVEAAWDRLGAFGWLQADSYAVC